MERETGIEPATNSLEGCDSTTELLPPSHSQTRLFTCARSLALRRAGPPVPLPLTARQSVAAKRRQENTGGEAPPHQLSDTARQRSPARGRKKVGGEGRVRTSVARRRQVYSLLRLTALPPPRKSLVARRLALRACPFCPFLTAPSLPSPFVVAWLVEGCCPGRCGSMSDGVPCVLVFPC
jgi:hypothetical protein